MDKKTDSPHINLSPVSSSNIKAIGYDPDTNTLAVEFNSSGVYHYQGVSQKDFDDFKVAKSIGSHFSKNILNKFKHTKLPPVKK